MGCGASQDADTASSPGRQHRKPKENPTHKAIGKVLKRVFDVHTELVVDPFNPTKEEVIRAVKLTLELRTALQGSIFRDATMMHTPSVGKEKVHLPSSFHEYMVDLEHDTCTLLATSAIDEGVEGEKWVDGLEHPLGHTIEDVAKALKLTDGPQLLLYIAHLVNLEDTILSASWDFASISSSHEETFKSFNVAASGMLRSMASPSTEYTALWKEVISVARGILPWQSVVKVDGPTSEGEELKRYFSKASSEVFEQLSVVRLCVQCVQGILAFLLGSNHSHYDQNTFLFGERSAPALLVSKQLDALWHTFFEACASPVRGMTPCANVERDVDTLRSIFIALGVLPSAALAPSEFHRWCMLLPSSQMSSFSKAVVLNISAILNGQQRFQLRGIRRCEIVDTSISKLSNILMHGDAPSLRVFPTFQAEGREEGTVEPGEGHGPRKEFFDCCAMQLSSSHSLPFQPPFEATITIEAESNIGAIHVRASHLLELQDLLTEGTILHVSATGVPFNSTIRKVSKAGSQRLQVELAEMPLVSLEKFSFFLRQKKEVQRFTVEDNRKYLWFGADGESEEADLAALDRSRNSLDASNASEGEIRDFNSPQKGGRSESMDLPAASSLNEFSFFGWLLGSCIVNGVSLPIPISTVFFRIVQCLLMDVDPLATNDLDVLSEQDLIELDDSFASTIKNIRSLGKSSAKWSDFLKVTFDEEEEADRIDYFIKQGAEGYVKEEIVQGTLFTKAQRRFAHIRQGFRASGIASVPFFCRLSSFDLQVAICGRLDDGKSDFSFSEEFSLVMPPTEWSCNKLAFLFRQIVSDALEGAFVNQLPAPTRKSVPVTTAFFKRTVLKFVTGRSTLSPVSQTESITLHLTAATANAVHCTDFDKEMCRLPSAHTCGNSLEIPNYLEMLLQGSKWCPFSAGHKKEGPGRHTVCSQKMSSGQAMTLWKKSDKNQRTAWKKEVGVHFTKQLFFAASNSATFELDDDGTEGPSGGTLLNRDDDGTEGPSGGTLLNRDDDDFDSITPERNRTYEAAVEDGPVEQDSAAPPVAINPDDGDGDASPPARPAPSSQQKSKPPPQNPLKKPPAKRRVQSSTEGSSSTEETSEETSTEEEEDEEGEASESGDVDGPAEDAPCSVPM